MVGTWASITRNDLVACRTELVVMSWDVVRSLRLVKYCELPTSYLRVATSCYDIQGDFSRVAATSREFTTTFLHSYEYPRVSTESKGPWFDPH